MSDDDLSGEKITEFVTKVTALPGCTDWDHGKAEKTARLFLRARKHDVDRAVELFKANKRMRYTENVISIDPLEDGVRRELVSGKFTILINHSEDEAAGTVAIFTANRHWPPLTTHRDTLKGVLYQLDFAMMDERCQRHGLIVLYDMRDTRYSNFDYHLCIKLLNLFKDIYPARLRKVIIVDAPFWFRAPFGVLRFFVKEKMRDRIFTVDYDELHVHLPPHLVETWFDQLTHRHQHFEWLRQCLDNSGHTSCLPTDYFTSVKPPIYCSLSQVSSSTAKRDLSGLIIPVDSVLASLPPEVSSEILRLHRVPGLVCQSDNENNSSNSDSSRSKDLCPFAGIQSTQRSSEQRRQQSVDRLHNTSGFSEADDDEQLPNGPSKLGSPSSVAVFPMTPVARATPSSRSLISSMYCSNHADSETDRVTKTWSVKSSAQRRRTGMSTAQLKRILSGHISSIGTITSPAISNGGNNSILRVTDLRRSSLTVGQVGRLNVTNPDSPTRLSIDEFISRVQHMNMFGYSAEFSAMFSKDQPVPDTCNKFQHPDNRRRNRYVDVPCLDSSAVRLSDNTYLHANWVNGYGQLNAYILAQGPLDNTKRDFWMAVWEHRVPVIVMLTKVVEGHRVKCATYWPTVCPTSPCSTSQVTPCDSSSPCDSRNSALFNLAKNTRSNTLDTRSAKSFSSFGPSSKPSSATSSVAQYGEFLVTNVGEVVEANGLYRHTRLTVSRVAASTPTRRSTLPRSPRLFSGKRASRVMDTGSNVTESSESPIKVDHLLYLGWPDFDVPSDCDDFLTFLETVKELHRSHDQTGTSVRIIREGQISPSPSSSHAMESVAKSNDLVSNSPPGSSAANYVASSRPLLIHCSAGIGRTGTFVTVDICLRQALAEGFIDLPDVVSCLRRQRAGAVQVAKQYAFAHQAIARQLECGLKPCSGPPMH